MGVAGSPTGGSWRDVRDRLASADTTTLDGATLDLLADAYFWTDEPDRSIEIRRHAYRTHVDAGADGEAAAAAWRLFFDHWLVGEQAPALGWLERCRRHVGRADDDVLRGWLDIADADRAAASGDQAAALDHATAAHRRVTADADLRAMALQAEGRALIALGDREAGVRRLDEAMVAVVNAELHPLFVGWVYCNTVAACYAIADLRRAEEWSAAANRWCAELEDGLMYPGLCRVYAVEIALLRGDWARAARDAVRACDELVAFDPRYAGAAFRLVADLHRLRGQLTDAERAYRRAHELGADPQPGLALLHLARGRSEAARKAAATFGGPPTTQPLQRAVLLDAVATIGAEAGDSELVDRAANELSELWASEPLPVVGAFAAAADGLRHLQQADHDAAAGRLRLAVRMFTEQRLPFEAARRRLDLADAARRSGDSETAELELAAAMPVLEALDARVELARAHALRGAGASAAGPLTRRELDVLELVARGATNAEVAARLSISPHTVARHMTNIRTKLGVGSRAAATATAIERGWFTHR